MWQIRPADPEEKATLEAYFNQITDLIYNTLVWKFTGP